MNNSYLPDAGGVFRRFIIEITSGDLFRHVFATLSSVFRGLVLSFLIGIPLSIAGAFTNFGVRVISPWIEFFRGIPTSMLFPLCIVTLGIGEGARTGIVAFANIPIIYVSLVAALSDREMNTFRTYYTLHKHRKINPFFLWLTLAWSSLPAIISGSKICLAVGLVLVVVAEMFFIANSGVGWIANQAYQGSNVDLFYTYVIITGLLGFTLNLILDTTLDFIKNKTQR